ncbi:hypothetical protein [Succinivibrio dextrinosolvens]|uniref:hypothetical protein n=1 Tax=Succinivibrio dextrinosolvens TaxID=83771 RepID=UPI001924BF72|nr:hypothetical protein [Succinivibrio dextrinosolvens]
MILIKRINEQIDISKVAEEDNEIVGTTEGLMKMDKTFTQIKMLKMTDMEHKPNGWNIPINKMTDEEWEDYYNRKADIHSLHSKKLLTDIDK